MLQRYTEVGVDARRRPGDRTVDRLAPHGLTEPLQRIVVTPPTGSHGRSDDPADDWQGLSPEGHDLAELLARDLAGTHVYRVLSSPGLRCRQTVMPLAVRRGLDVEPVSALASGAAVTTLAELVISPALPHAVMCVDEMTLRRLATHLRGSARSSARLMSGWTSVGWVLTLVPREQGPSIGGVLTPVRRAPTRPTSGSPE